MFALFSLGFLHMLNKSDCMSQSHSSFSSVLVNQFIPGMNWLTAVSEPALCLAFWVFFLKKIVYPKLGKISTYERGVSETN